MKGGLLHSCKPAATARTHVLVAALLWTVVGALLLTFGIKWAWHAAGPHTLLLLAAAIGAGAAKAHFVLRKAARRIVARIRERGDGCCLGGFVSWKTYLLIAVMATTGRLLRGGLLPKPIVGLVYAGIGAALLLAAWTLWTAWRCFPPLDEPAPLA